MSEETKGNPAWRKGVSPNPAGRPKGTGRPVSTLRKTLNRLKEMEDKALENIQMSIDSGEIDKEALATSKWLVTTMVTLNRAAIADEQLSFNIKAYREEKEEAKKEGTTGTTVRFSTKMLKSVDEEE